MASIRQEKYAALIQQEISVILQQKAQVICLGAMVSVTVVRVTPDLATARIYLSVFAHPDKQKVFESVVTHTGLIRKELGNKIRKQVRHIPALHFIYDDSIDYANKIDKLLKE